MWCFVQASIVRVAVLSLAVVGLLGGCRSPEQDAKDQEAAMIARAQADSAQEAQFRTDSVRLAATFRVDTIAKTFSMPQRLAFEDADGETRDTTLTAYIAQSRTGRFCTLKDASLWRTRAVGDTLTCQWADRVEPLSPFR